MRVGERAFGTDDAVCDSRLGHEKRARDLVRGEPAGQAQRERKWANAGTFNLLRLVAQHGMARRENQAEKIVAMSFYFRSRSERRRARSIARCFAVAMSHAPGFDGTLSRGHSSSAATSAACARSSATPTSCVMRVRPAIRRGDSMRQTASIAGCVSAFGPG